MCGQGVWSADSKEVLMKKEVEAGGDEGRGVRKVLMQWSTHNCGWRSR